MRPHPLGVLPEGNRYLVSPEAAAASARARLEGLGAFAALPDATLMRLLSGGDEDDGVGAEALASLSLVSRVFRAFACHEDLWKAEVLRRDGGAFVFRGASWRETYRHGAEASRRGDERRDVSSRRVEPEILARDASPVRKNAAATENATENTPPRIFSDALYSRHLAAHRPLDPAWLEKETIPVLECASSASPEEDSREDSRRLRDAFVSEYEARGEPVILRGACAKWAATHADMTKSPWSLDALRARIANKNATFSVGGYPVTLDAWAAYCDACAPSDEKKGGSGPVDDAPLYLFDKSFVETAPEIFGPRSPVGFEPPAIVCGDDEKDDLFALLSLKTKNALHANDDASSDAQSSSRPDHRWFIHGPARSGSSFHVDPNGTSAWNAVVFGAKRWILFAPDGAPPPGVHPSLDGATVAQPVTLVEWYAGFYEHAYEYADLEETSGDESDDDDAEDGAEPSDGAERSREKGSRVKNREKYSVREGTCRAGDVLFVPSGWWHAALNLTETAAVTQNFCSPRTAPRTLRFLKRAAAAGKTPNPGLAADLVSGLESRDKRGSLYADFLEALRKHRPEVLRAKEVRRVLGEDGFFTKKTGEEAEADEAEADEAPGGNPEASDCLSIRAKRPRASPLTRSGRESPPPKKKEKPPAGTNALAGLFAAETAGAESASFAFGF